MQTPNSSFSVAELRKALEEYAASWIARAKAKESNKEKEFELPKEFEKLCGSISLNKIETLAASDEGTQLRIHF